MRGLLRIGIFASLASILICTGQAVAAALDRFVAFIFAAVSPASPMPATGQFDHWAGHLSIVRDPRVERHEAGTSRRAAARGT